MNFSLNSSELCDQVLHIQFLKIPAHFGVARYFIAHLHHHLTHFGRRFNLLGYTLGMKGTSFS